MSMDNDIWQRVEAAHLRGNHKRGDYVAEVLPNGFSRVMRVVAATGEGKATHVCKAAEYRRARVKGEPRPEYAVAGDAYICGLGYRGKNKECAAYTREYGNVSAMLSDLASIGHS